MKRILAVWVIGLSLVIGSGSVWASDDSARANSLFVEAVQLIQSSQNTLNDKEKLEQLDNALGKLNRIIDKYPSSDLAVKLITGQSIGNINLKTVAESLRAVAKSIKEVEDNAKKDACYEAPTTKCVLVIALSEAKTIEGALQRLDALRSIAEAQANAGDIKAAFSTAKTIEDASWRSIALLGIAVAQANAGDIKAAFATAKTIEGAFWRSGALSGIAEAQANAGDIKAAFATAKTIEDADDRSGALSGIAVAQANAGDIKASQSTITLALNLAKTIEDAYDRSYALRGIAEALSSVKSD